MNIIHAPRLLARIVLVVLAVTTWLAVVPIVDFLRSLGEEHEPAADDFRGGEWLGNRLRVTLGLDSVV
jgi:hypothetical protein